MRRVRQSFGVNRNGAARGGGGAVVATGAEFDVLA